MGLVYFLFRSAKNAMPMTDATATVAIIATSVLMNGASVASACSINCDADDASPTVKYVEADDFQ